MLDTTEITLRIVDSTGQTFQYGFSSGVPFFVEY